MIGSVLRVVAFSPSGRVSRERWWCSMIALWAVAAAVLSVSAANSLVWLFALYFPFFAGYGVMVSVARLHDAGKSGWFLLIAAIPLAGFYLFYVLGFTAQSVKNGWGNPPHWASPQQAKPSV